MRPFIALLLVMLSRVEARPCSRLQSPFETDAIAVGAADVIVVVEAVTVANDVATVKVAATVMGGPLASKRVFRIRGVHTEAEEPKRMCGKPTMEPGRRYVILAWDPKQSGELVPIDAYGGIRPDSDATRLAIKQARLQPAIVSPWRMNQNGTIAARVVHYWQKNDETNLMVILRNDGKEPFTFERRVWPEAQQSRCMLQVFGPEGPVAARRVPISDADIVDYFDHHAPAPYRLPIAPGGVALIMLPRVSAAPPGWGYKEELGFRYWPLDTARGTDYAVSVVCERFVVGAEPVTTGFVTIYMR